MRSATDTGVRCWMAVAHRDPRTGLIHGHTYVVTAWWPSEPGIDARDLQDGLQAVLAAYSHAGVLPDELASGEALWEAILPQLDGCIDLEISRGAEGIFVRGAR